MISGDRKRSEVLTWAVPDADVEVCDPKTTLPGASVSAGFMFTATDKSIQWMDRVDPAIIGAILRLFPMNSVSTLSVLNDTRLSKEFWLSQAPRLPLLERARLIPTAVRAFRDMLAEEAPPSGPRLPSLTSVVLVDVKLNARRTYHLRDMLMERVEQGVPLEVLDLGTCFVGYRAIRLLKEVVVEVQETLARPIILEGPEFFENFDWHGGIGYWDQVEYYDIRNPWYFSYGSQEAYDELFDE
jgi:hypothetical protein